MNIDELKLRRVSYAELRDVERYIGMPEAPVYEFTGAGGAKAVRRHNETTLQSKADLEQWEGYERALHNFFERRNCFLVALALEEQPDIPAGWVEEQKKRPWSNIPDLEHELVGFYVLRELCQTPTEYNALISRVLEKGGFIEAQEIADKADGF